MSNKKAIYYPYKTQSKVLPFLCVMEMLLLGFLLYIVAFSKINIPFVLFFVGMGVCFLVLIRHLYKQAQLAVVFDASGLCLYEHKGAEGQQISWDHFSHLYTYKNYRGFRYFVLASERLDVEQRKKAISVCERTGRLVVGKNVVLAVDILQNMSWFESLLQEKIRNTP